MAKQKNIEKYNFLYVLLRKYICLMLSTVFYKKIIIKYDEPLPKNTPIIFAANHQNALMDALLLICSASKQIVFFARADMFKNRFMAKFLMFFKIAPIYRIRDGMESLQLNHHSFSIASSVLASGNCIGIFPEGQHNDAEFLLSLKKGLSRIAFQAEAENNFNLNIHVVPIGISYSDYFKPRKEVVIQFCQAILLSSYRKIYLSNPTKAYKNFNSDLSNSIKQKIIHISDKNDYDLIQYFRKLMLEEYKISSYFENIEFSKNLIEKLKESKAKETDKYDKLMQNIKEYKAFLEKNNLSHYGEKIKSLKIYTLIIWFLFFLISFPLYFFVCLLFYLPLMLPFKIVNKRVKDSQFKSSIYFIIISLFTIPMFATLYMFFIWFYTKSFIFLVCSIPIFLLLAIFFKIYRKSWKNFVFLYNILKLRIKDEKELCVIKNLEKTIIDFLTIKTEN